MHRYGKHDKSGDRKKEFGRQPGRYSDDTIETHNKTGRSGRRHWQQEKQLLQQMDLKNLSDYLLDQE